MAFPAEHFGAVKKRAWYKVRWVRNPPGHEARGMFDVLTGDAVERYRGRLEVLERIETQQCAIGLPLGFGKSEEDVDEWIAKNKEQFKS